MSKILIKILDYSILPASIMLLSKLLGLFLVSFIAQIPFSIKEYVGSTVPVTTVLSAADQQIITGYSDAFMFLVIALFFSVYVYRSIYLNASTVKEAVILSLAKRNLLNLIKDSFSLYSAATSWLMFLVLGNILIWLNIADSKGYLLIGIISTIFTIATSLVLIIDVQKEVDNIKKHPAKYEWY